MDDRLTSDQVKAILRDVLSEGTTGRITFASHADKELQKDGKTRRDAINTLRGGVVDPAEWENGAWRYPVRTMRMCVVIEIDTVEHVVVITAWRLA